MTDAPSILQARKVTKRFGGLVAVHEVDLDVGAREIVGLIGPNGAGKTTFFNCLTGMLEPTSGQVLYRGQELPGNPARVTKAGVARTFQNIRLFPNMSALENVLVGRHCRTRAGVLAAIGRGPAFRREERESEARSTELLAFVGLSRHRDTLAKNLPYGDQRRLEIARALATDPGLLLLDEPTAGMNPNETGAAMDLVRRVRDQGLSVVVIEHDMRFIFNLCDRVAVLVQGSKLVEGSPSEVQSDPRVIEAYLGAPRGYMSALLEVNDVRVSYGRIEAVKGVSFSVEAGSLVTLIGSNGAGKTTVLRTVSGLLRPTSGEILFDGERIDQVPAHEIVERGLAHAPEGRRIFPRMTVEENLDLGAFTRSDGQEAITGDRDGVYERFPVLGERRSQAAGTLSGGEQQMLAMGRALMCRPRLLMLDEPSMGLSPIMMRRIFDALAELKAAGTTVLLVEQNASAALALADEAHVLETGRIVLSGTGADLRDNPQVRKAYLGED